MRECQKCKNPIPLKAVIGGKKRNLQRRKYCFSCSPFPSKNRRKIELNIPILEGRLVSCTECNREYLFFRHSGMTSRVCVSCISRLSRLEYKKRAVEYKGGCCQVCGYNSCYSALDFHHLNPKEKDFGIGGFHGKWSTLVKELEKCILLCRNCHSETHENLFTKERIKSLVAKKERVDLQNQYRAGAIPT